MSVSRREINLREVRARIGYLVDRAEHAGEVTIITRHGRPAAAIVPIDRIKEPAMAATAQDLAYAVSLTLGGHIDDFDIPAIVEEIRRTYGPVGSIDDVPTDEYNALIERHDKTARVYTLTVVEGEDRETGNGVDITADESPISFSDLPDEVTDWLEANGFDADHPDRWVLVTPGTGHPGEVNVIASRVVTL